MDPESNSGFMALAEYLGVTGTPANNATTVPVRELIPL